METSAGPVDLHLQILLFFLIFFGNGCCHSETSKAENIKKKLSSNTWLASDFMDLEHLKSELKEVTRLQANGELSRSEQSAYFFRLHDFDDNKLLDGIEVGLIVRHLSDEPFADDAMAKAVDIAMNMDLNNDGFIDYPELMYAFQKEEAARKQQEHQQLHQQQQQQAPQQQQHQNPQQHVQQNQQQQQVQQNQQPQVVQQNQQQQVVQQNQQQQVVQQNQQQQPVQQIQQQQPVQQIQQQQVVQQNQQQQVVQQNQEQQIHHQEQTTTQVPQQPEIVHLQQPNQR